jgi:uncharacterized membrane protein YhaH (DUF805 family)
MRGDVLDYTAVTGEGLISGEDGRRYRFGPDQIGRASGLRVGAKVDFEPRDDVATGIFPLLSAAGAPRPVERDLGLWGYFAKCMKLYFDGRGRATRKEYWSFILFRAIFMTTFMVLIISAIVALGAFGAANAQDYGGDASDPSSAFSGLWVLGGWILGLPFLAPHYAVSARRLHDVGMSGWLALLMLIPYVGAIFMFIVALIPSQQTRNQYDLAPDTSVF